MKALRLIVLFAGVAVAAGAAAEAPMSEDEQLRILDEIGAAVAGTISPQSVAPYFRKDAVFAGAVDYLWDLTGFRNTLSSRDCSTEPSRSIKAEHILIGFSEAELDAAKTQPGYGPGLIFYCISPRRVAAHEIYMFRFKGKKISRVSFARSVAVPRPPPRPSAKESSGRG